MQREWTAIAGELAGGLGALAKFGIKVAIIATVIALAITAGIDALIALWAPADPIIRDFNRAVDRRSGDADQCECAGATIPTTFTADNGIVVNVNKTIPPLKLPLEYHETREYVSDDQRIAGTNSPIASVASRKSWIHSKSSRHRVLARSKRLFVPNKCPEKP